MGFLSKITGALFGSKAPSSGVADVRDKEERELAKAQAQHFLGLMGKPDFGYADETAAMDPYYERQFQDYSRRVSGAAADRGFGPLRHGPSVSTIGRGAQQMAEGRAADAVARREAYKRWVFSGGREAATPMGRTSYQIPGRGSAFGALLGPALGAFGKGFGGPIGGMAASGFGSLFGGGGSQPFQSAYSGLDAGNY